MLDLKLLPTEAELVSESLLKRNNKTAKDLLGIVSTLNEKRK